MTVIHYKHISRPNQAQIHKSHKQFWENALLYPRRQGKPGPGSNKTPMRKLNYKNSFIASLFVNVLLLLALGLLLAFFLWGRGGPARLQTPDAEREETPGLSINEQALLEQAFAYGVSIDYLQLVLPDYFIYYFDGDYRYELLDPQLGLHRYDWSRLVYDQGRLDYADPELTGVQTGVDVSYYQGEIDWAAVAGDGVDFAMVRLGYRGYESGALVTDETAGVNLAAAAAAGLDLGAYFFSQAITVEEAQEEARLALELLDGRELAYPVAFDMEEIWNQTARVDGLSREQATDIALAFCQAIEQGGYQSMIYGNTAWLAGRLDLSRLQDSNIWLAQYSSRPNYPYHMNMWQYTSSGTVAGVSGQVDLNLYFGQ